MSVLAISVSSVALAEIGDKTQLLSFLLASRFRKPFPIVVAIFTATLLNHALAAWLGVVVSDFLSPTVLKWLLVASFLIMALWILIPDKLEGNMTLSSKGPFVASFVAFFIAEIGDKTQVATTMLGASYPDAVIMVILGTTLGMLIANVPVVFAGKYCSDKLPLDAIRKVTCALFVSLAMLTAIAH
ncbi:hypothetical protein CS022_19800 [Veronia nyctiphanis]|uniref:GDT1 family protein n=1 Tax=Veronia nyctiphanis TaxID=1278244 RepID=A0A4Q0YS80_9GAMM|nr:TMEM165/GDT1 family protein [Veronia nyctiphanis]RXJ71811.1 hypothetical protein CS022_19800 [Veronia nyctiphanis]